MKLIKLTQGQVAKVSDEWYDGLSKWKWHAFWNKNTGSFYAVRSDGKSPHQSKIWMHKEVGGAGVGTIVDHINHDTLDNTPENLRACNVFQNNQNARKRKDNTSGYKGVSKKGKKWIAQVRANKQIVLSRTFETPEEAALEYDKYASLHFGEFAVLNFPTRS